MNEYLTLRIDEGTLRDAVTRKTRTIDIVDDAGALLGQVTRGKISGCEKTSTFSFTPVAGEPVAMGIRKRGLTSLLRARIRIEHAGGRDEIVDKKWSSLIGFHAVGTLAGESLVAKESFRGDVVVTHGEREIATLHPEDWAHSSVDVLAEADELTVAVAVLLLFMYRIYEQEAGVAGELFGD